MCDDMGALRQLAQTSHAVILAPHDAAQSAAPDPSLVRLEIDLSEPLHTHYGIVTLAQRNPSPAAQVFMRLVHEVLEGASSH
ncbi:MAG: LysR substrate-binding domain-containing protein [Polaromonas sp.]